MNGSAAQPADRLFRVDDGAHTECTAAIRSTTGDAVQPQFPLLALAAPVLVAVGYWVTVRLNGVVDLPATSPQPPVPAALVGHACVVSTARLGPTYGRADVVTGGGRSAEIQVRLAGRAPHAAGWTARIYGYDATHDCFWITPIDSATLTG
jgi:hypothetical protein